MKTLIIGTRGSKLALAQTRLVAEALRATDAALEVHVEVISTKGDRMLDVPLSQIGDKGLFVKELEVALLNGEIDLAVHSAKDLPSMLPEGLTLGAFMPRADARDALVLRHTPADPFQSPLSLLSHGARVGTSSLRRISQLLHHRPDLNIVDMRGNVDTRLRKLAGGQYDAIVLAMAGLERLGIIDVPVDNAPVLIYMDDTPLLVVPIPTETMLPAIAQGTLAIECRAGDQDTLRRLSAINHNDTQRAALAERAFLRRLEGGCQVPIAAFAQVDAGRIHVAGLVGSHNGARVLRQASSEHAADAEAQGTALAERMLAGGAQALLDEARIQQNQPLRGMRVVITRAEGRGNKLATKLHEAGAIPILYPVIAHTPPDDLLAFNEAIRNMVAGTYDWLVVTSATAVQAIHESVIRIGASHGEWRRRMHVAVIGAGTAQACIDLLGLQPHIVPEAFNAHALAGAMGDVRGQRILLPNADIARPALQAALQAAGAQVVRVIAYKTVPAGQNPIDMNQLLLAGSVDAICFTSGSTVRHFASRLSDDALRVAQRTRISCIGASTAAAAAALGFEKATVAREASDNGLIEALHMPPPPDTST